MGRVGPSEAVATSHLGGSSPFCAATGTRNPTTSATATRALARIDDGREANVGDNRNLARGHRGRRRISHGRSLHAHHGHRMRLVGSALFLDGLDANDLHAGSR